MHACPEMPATTPPVCSRIPLPLNPPGRHYPGELEKVLVWFRDYKIPDGKPANKFGYDNVCKNKEFTMHVVAETHDAYVKLKSGARANDGLSLI
jgi:inorganic pyrophosphatase